MQKNDAGGVSLRKADALNVNLRSLTLDYVSSDASWETKTECRAYLVSSLFPFSTTGEREYR